MRIDVDVDEGVTFLAVSGDVDVATAQQLQDAGEQALTSYSGTLRIDLAEVSFLDSAGIGALVAIRNKTAETRHTLVLDNPSEQVVLILAINGLTDAFQIERRANGSPTRAVSKTG